MDARTITCPNCGANTTNFHNCEYCDSLLVRFVSQEIDIEDDVFGEKAYTISGLDKALEENLLIQEALTKSQTVVTSVEDINNPNDCFQICPAQDVSLGTDRESPFKDTIGPSLALRMSFMVNSLNVQEAAFARQMCQNFRSLTISQLFTEQQWQYGTDYYIDFGKDVRNAVHICSKLAHVVASWDKSTSTQSDTTIVQKDQISLVNQEGHWNRNKIIWASILWLLLCGIIIFIFS